jgi:peptidoglycan/LPS O-acetylase OafA/YrhL
LLLWHGQSDSTRYYFVSRFAASRFIEFLVGVWLARVFLTSSERRPAVVSSVMQGAGIVLIIAGAMYAPYAAWPLLGGGLLYVPGSTLLILGLAYGGGFLVTHLSRPLLKRLGTASFSFYLIHEPLLRSVRGVCLFFGWAVHSWPAFAAALVSMFVAAQTAAFLICYWYEIPLQKRLRMVDLSRFQRHLAWSSPKVAE